MAQLAYINTRREEKNCQISFPCITSELLDAVSVRKTQHFFFAFPKFL